VVDEPDSGAVEDEPAADEKVDSREDLDVRIDAMLEEKLSTALPSLEEYCTEENLRVLTVLIGDQVGSSRITSEHINLEGKAFRNDFRGIYEEICKKHKGIHVEYAGDEFLAVFSSPSNAVRCALALQAKYRDHSPFEVRIGLHDGEIVAVEEERTHSQATIMKEVFGREVNICARICGMSCAERILMSRSVFDKARANIPSKPSNESPELNWANWGGYFFNGVERNGEPEAYEVCEVYQTEHGPREAPGIREKSRPKGHDDDIFGWRPGPEAVLPGTKWRLIQKLGEGGFGEVWLAQDKGGRQTVFKFCTKKSKLRSLRREYEVFNALVEEGISPPGITEVIGAHDDRDGDKPPYYIQLKYCAGGDLRQWLAGPGRGAPRRIQLDVALQAVRAVERIHAKDCIHRDIKPSNFLLEAATDPTRPPVLKICDFGIGQAVLEAAIKHGDNSQDMHGGGGKFALSTNELMQGAGTFLFIAPELVVRRETTPGKVSKQAEASADIYSLGVTLYQVFTGDPEAIPGPGLTGIADDPILTEDIAACLDPDPTQRPTAAELADRLERYTSRRRARQIKLMAMAGAIVIVLLVAVVSGYLLRDQARLESVAEIGHEELQISTAVLGKGVDESTYTRVRRGAALASGDSYFLTVEPQSDGYLYVVRTLSSDSLELLFPFQQHSSNSPEGDFIRAGERIEIPPADMPPFFVDESESGEYRFYFILANAPWAEFVAPDFDDAEVRQTTLQLLESISRDAGLQSRSLMHYGANFARNIDINSLSIDYFVVQETYFLRKP